jgi:DNA primase catalytic core
MTKSDYELDAIRRAVDIIRLVGRYVRLRKAGVQYVGLCPFHKEHTPSFYVHPIKKLWKCFGCGAGGDMFDFIKGVEGVTFQGAKEILAREAGVVLSTWTSDQRRRYAHEAAAAEIENRAFAEWLKTRIETYTIERDRWFRTFHRTRCVIRDYGLDSPTGLVAWDLCEEAEKKYEALDEVLETLRNAPHDELLAQFRRERRTAAG